MIKRHKGGQLGNQNARKHGLYSRTLTPEEKRRLPRAQMIQTLDHEIALTRLRILSLLKSDPDNLRLFLMAINVLMRLKSLRRRLS